MKFAKSLAFVAACMLASPVMAHLIRFSHEGTGSGTLDGKAFGDTSFVITAVADTNDVVSMLPFATYVPHVTSSITIDGVGTFDFVNPTTTFVEHLGQFGAPAVGFGPLVSGEPVGVFWGPLDPVFGGWGTTRSVGPVSGDGFHIGWSFSPAETTGGTLIFDDTDFFEINATFEAVSLAPVIEVDPDSLSSTLQQGQMETRPLTIANPGEEETLDWQVTEEAGTGARILRPTGFVTIPGMPDGIDDEHGLARSANAPDRRTASHPFTAPLGDEVALTHSESQDIQSGNTLVCSPDNGVTTHANQFLRTFTLTDFDIRSDFEVTEVAFAVELVNDVTVPITVNLYTLEGDFVYANMTAIGTTTEELPPQDLTLVTVPVMGTVPAGSTLVVEIAAPDLSDTGAFFPGSNNQGETAPSYVAASACNMPEPRPFAYIGFEPVHLVMSVTGIGTVEPLDCTLPDWVNIDPLGGSVSADDAQVVDVTFDASGLAPGEFDATLCLASDDPVTPLAVVPLSLAVTSAAVPELVFEPSSLDFDDVVVGTVSPPRMATLWNTGDADATGLVFSTPGNGFEVVATDCGDELPAGDSCEVSVTLSPGEPGPVAATLEVSSDQDVSAGFNVHPDSAAPSLMGGSIAVVPSQGANVLELTGNGVLQGPPGELEIEPAKLVFDQVIIGSSAVAIATVTHDAGPDAADLVLAGIDLTGNPAFTVTGGDCAQDMPLAPQENCTVEISFTPAEVGVVAGVLQVASADGQLEVVGLAGAGVDASEPPDDVIFGDRFEQ